MEGSHRIAHISYVVIQRDIIIIHMYLYDIAIEYACLSQFTMQEMKVLVSVFLIRSHHHQGEA